MTEIMLEITNSSSATVSYVIIMLVTRTARLSYKISLHALFVWNVFLSVSFLVKAFAAYKPGSCSELHFM